MNRILPRPRFLPAALLVSSFLLHPSSFAGNAVITLLDGFNNAVTNTRVVLTSSSLPQSQNGGTAVQWRAAACTDASGQIVLTNAAPGTWQVQPVNQNLAAFTFYMPATNGTIRAEDFLIAAAGSTLPPDTFSYGVNASDRRYDAAGAAANAVLSTLAQTSNSFAGTAIVTNFATAILSGAGYAMANGGYLNYDWPDIIAGNCVNATNSNIYILGGGATNAEAGTLTANVLELDDYSGSGVNIYYATNFTTNAAQIVWFAATNSYNPVPTARSFTLTNLVANLGPLAVAQVATQITAAVTAGGTNLEAALAGLNHPPGFSGAGLTNQGTAGPEIWGGFTKPYFVLYVEPYNLNNEAQTVAAVNWLATNGYVAAFTNGGLGVMLYLDIEASYRRATNGMLQWNYSLFPDGPGYLVNYCATHGIRDVMVGLYGTSQVHLPAGATGGLISQSGGNAGGVFFYTGTGTNYGTNYADITLPEQIPADVATVSGWGATAIAINDLAEGLAPAQQLQSEVGTACAALRTVTNNRPLAFTAFDTADGQPYGVVNGAATARYHSAFASDQEANDPETFLRYLALNFAGLDKANHGAYPCYQQQGYSAQPLMTALGLWSGFVETTGGLNPLANLTNSPLVTLATNALWQTIDTDAGQFLPNLVTDLGTNGSIWTKPLAGGRFAVGVFNGGNAGSNITVALPAIAQGGLTYAVTNVWTGGYLGTFGASLVASNLMARGASNCAALWLCTPLAPAPVSTNGLATTNYVNAATVTNALNIPLTYTGGTNVVVNLQNYTNSGQVGFSLTLTNNAWLTVTNLPQCYSFTVDVYQNATGGFALGFATNVGYAPAGQYPAVTTNAGAWSTLTFHSGTAGNYTVIYTLNNQ